MQATINGKIYDTERASLVDATVIHYDGDGVDVLKLYANGDHRFVVCEPDSGPAYIEPLDPDLSNWLAAATGVGW